MHVVTTEITLTPPTDGCTVLACFCGDDGDVWLDVFHDATPHAMHLAVLAANVGRERALAARAVGSSRPTDDTEIVVWEIH